MWRPIPEVRLLVLLCIPPLPTASVSLFTFACWQTCATIALCLLNRHPRLPRTGNCVAQLSSPFIMAPKRAAATKKVASPAPATRRSTRQTAPSAKVAAGEKAVSSGKAVKKSVAKGAKTAATKSISPERVERKLPAKAPRTAGREKTAPATESSPPKRGRPAEKGASPKKISPVKGGSPAKKAALAEEDEHHDAPPQKEKPCAVQIGNDGFKIQDSEPYPDELPRDKATEIVEDLIARFRDPMKSKNAAEDLLLHAAYYVLRSALFGGGQYCKAAKAPTEELRKVFEEALSKERFGHGNTLVEILTRRCETQNYFDPESSLEHLQNGVPRRLMSWEKTTLDDMRPIEEELKARHDGKSGPPSLKQLKTFFDRLKAARYGMARSAEVDVKRQVALWNEVTGEDFDGVFAGGRKAELASWKRLEKTLAEWPAEGVKPSIEGRDRKADKGKAVTGMARSKRPAKAVSTSPAKSHPRSPTRSASKSPAASKGPRRSTSPVKSTSKTSVGVGRNLWDPDQGFEELHPPETRGAEPNNTILGNQRTATRSQSNASVTRSNGLARRSPCKSPAPARRASRSPVRGRSQSPAATAGPSKAVKPPRTASSIQRALRRIGTAEEQRMREGYQDRLVRLPPSRKSSSGRAKSAGDDAAAPPSNKRKRTPSPDKTTRSKSPAKARLGPSAHSDSSQGSPSPRKKKSRKTTVRDVEDEQVYDLGESALMCAVRAR